MNLCDDNKLKEIVNVHPKYNETCIDLNLSQLQYYPTNHTVADPGGIRVPQTEY